MASSATVDGENMVKATMKFVIVFPRRSDKEGVQKLKIQLDDKMGRLNLNFVSDFYPGWEGVSSRRVHDRGRKENGALL